MTLDQDRFAAFVGAALVAASLVSFNAFGADEPAKQEVKEGSAAATPTVPAPAPPKRADFQSEPFSSEARQIADWVVDSGDNKDKPFAIVDKVAAKVFVFEPDGHLRGAAPALLGIAKGDHNAPGIGERELSAIRLQDRTTPAGRFVATMGFNNKGKDILWVDYDSALSMHRVINTRPQDRRPHRLATPTPLDNRISFGCINVPIKFFDTVVSPTFTGKEGIVYILPETKSAQSLFSSYDVEQRALMRQAQATASTRTSVSSPAAGAAQ
jgi:hypothetical protein